MIYENKPIQINAFNYKCINDKFVKHLSILELILLATFIFISQIPNKQALIFYAYKQKYIKS